MVRKFLYAIAGLVVLFVLGRLALMFFAQDLSEWAFVPDVPFQERPAMAANAWENPAMWLARPGMAQDPSRWQPVPVEARPAPVPQVATFFVHPTSYIDKTDWNADLTDPVSRHRAGLFVKAMASPFNLEGPVWAPRYRQAAVGAFLTARPEANAAIDLAYRDVLAAFDVFLKANPKGPIALAGHSQGAFLLRRLLRDRVAGTPVADRIVAAYVVGWPVSLDHDLPRMGLPPCRGPDQSGCVVSWLTVADPSDTAMLMQAYARRTGLDGQSVAGSAFLCTDPLTGMQDGQSSAEANLGTLVPDLANETGTIVAKTVPAACGPDHFLHIGPPPKLGLDAYVLPGNNFHLFDITLFWANLRADYARRAKAWRTVH